MICIDSLKYNQELQIDLENSNTASTSFTSLNLPNDQYFVFQLIVQDNNITYADIVNVYDLYLTNKLKAGNELMNLNDILVKQIIILRGK